MCVAYVVVLKKNVFRKIGHLGILQLVSKFPEVENRIQKSKKQA